MNNQSPARNNAVCHEVERNDRCKACRRYPLRAIAFLVLLIAFAVGLVLGAVYYETILPVLATVIAFAVTLAVIVIALLIYYWCRRGE